jgi:hypothetical protein
MTHEEKLNVMFKDLGERGVKKGTMAPPLYRLLWRIGVPVRPPHFASFGANALLMGIGFAFLWGLFMWFFLWRHQNMSPSTACLNALLAGALFGVMLSGYYRWQARKLSLPKWEDYPTQTI